MEMIENITASPGFLRYEPQKIRFDGRDFYTNGMMLVAYGLYLAKRARDGDEDAIELLSVFGVQINDADDNPYWPM